MVVRLLLSRNLISAAPFSEGLARVRVDGKWGYINTEGEVVIEPQFDDAGSFSKGVLGSSLVWKDWRMY